MESMFREEDVIKKLPFLEQILLNMESIHKTDTVKTYISPTVFIHNVSLRTASRQLNVKRKTM